MAKLSFEVDACIECPCLQNIQYGTFTCFYCQEHQFDSYEITDLYEYCPLKEENKIDN